MTVGVMVAFYAGACFGLVTQSPWEEDFVTSSKSVYVRGQHHGHENHGFRFILMVVYDS